MKGRVDILNKRSLKPIDGIKIQIATSYILYCNEMFVRLKERKILRIRLQAPFRSPRLHQRPECHDSSCRTQPINHMRHQPQKAKNDPTFLVSVSFEMIVTASASNSLTSRYTSFTMSGFPCTRVSDNQVNNRV